MAEWLDVAVPYLLAVGVAAAIFGVVRSKVRRTAFRISIAALALAVIVFVLSVIIRSMSSIPV
jgi:uncharacterized membrane protein YgdD (TMEM256/DUF423 family)